MPEAKRPIRVFLCHASQDKPAVRELYKRLKAEDWIDPWLDEEKLTLGQHWTSAIEDALDLADVVVIFLSNNSVQKEGFVQRELNYAWEISLEKPRNVIFLIPFRLDNCEVPRYLRSRQWGDYFGEERNRTYQTLLRSLKERHEQKLRLEEDDHSRWEKEKQERNTKIVSDQEVVDISVQKNNVREKLAFDASKKNSAKKEERQLAWLRKMLPPSAFTFSRIITVGILISLIWFGFRVIPQYLPKTLNESFPTATPQPVFSVSKTETTVPSSTPLFTNKTTNDGLGSNHVQGVYAEGRFVYVATTNGLSVSSNGGVSFLNKTIDNGLGSDNVIGVYAVGDSVYAATIDGLSISFDGGDRFVTKTTSDGLGSNKINGVYVDKGDVYVATDNGLGVSDDGGDTFVNKTASDGLGSDLVYSVYHVDYITYVATSNGLSMSFDNGNKFVNKTTNDGLGSNVVYGVYKVGENIYVATEGGLSISTDKGMTFTNLTGSGQFSWVNGVYATDNKIYCATLWLTGLAVSKDNGVSFALYTTSDGLGSNSVYHVYVSDGVLYVATSNGLSYALLNKLP